MADWSSLTSREDVDFLLALSTFSNVGLFKVIPPTDSSVLCQRLTTPHRNSANITRFFKFYLQHIGAGYLSGIEEDKQAKHLPPGRLPVWVERSKKVTDVQVLEFIKENYVADPKLSVTVVDHGYTGDAAEDW